MNVKSIIFTIVIIVCCILFVGCNWVRVVPIGSEENTEMQSEEIDPEVYAVEIWPEIFDYATKNSQPIEEVIPLFLIDKNAAGNKYGYRLDENSWWQFMVTGRAKVIKYNIESKAGVLELDLEPYDDIVDCNLQIGTVVKGQALRDSMPFIKFQDFKDQVQFGKIATEINNYAVENVISTVVTADIKGKIISFTGAFTAEPGKGILIVPVELSVSGE